ncbi:DUF1499 domain-containing protein [Jiella sp. M17.18]|uniref:DUF1499 domain-containing protein n=1 Tax=Jiella sp. M17.18 TaxID=3234247 RepID=UPI0034DF15DD
MNSVYGRLPVSGHYLRKRLRLAGFSRSLATFSLLLIVIGVVVFRLGGIVPQALIGLLLLGVALAALAFVVALYGLARVWIHGVTGGGAVVAGFGVSLLALAPFGLAAYLAFANPQTNAAYTEALAPDSIAAVIDAAQPTGLPLQAKTPATPSIVSGRRYLADAPTVYKAARDVLDAKGWKIDGVIAGDPAVAAERRANGDLGVSGTVDIPVPTPRSSAELEASAPTPQQPDSDQYRISAVARDPLFALPSDVEIQIVQDGNETFVDMRSVSRSIGIDLGQNRRFIRSFLDDLDAAMTGKGTTD